MNILNFSEIQILQIDKLGDLFTNDKYMIKCEYRDLAKKWHPDVNDKDTSEVFAHINDLYNKALDSPYKNVMNI